MERNAVMYQNWCQSHVAGKRPLNEPVGPAAAHKQRVLLSLEVDAAVVPIGAVHIHGDSSIWKY